MRGCTKWKQELIYQSFSFKTAHMANPLEIVFNWDPRLKSGMPPWGSVCMGAGRNEEAWVELGLPSPHTGFMLSCSSSWTSPLRVKWKFPTSHPQREWSFPSRLPGGRGKAGRRAGSAPHDRSCVSASSGVLVWWCGPRIPTWNTQGLIHPVKPYCLEQSICLNNH